MMLRSTGKKRELIRTEIRLATKFLPMKKLNAILIDTQIFKLLPRSINIKLIL